MGLFNFFSGQFIDVIEWVDETKDTIVWKYPDEDREIKMGAQLTVRESQAAIFLNEGKMGDVYGPGRHELTTRNMPIMTTLKSWAHGFNSPFKCDVYFVNTSQKEIKWGTKQPILIRDPEFDAVRIRAFGLFTFKVSDPALFFKEVAGTDPHVTTDEIVDRFRTAIISKFTSAIGKTGKSILDLASMGADLGTELAPYLKEDFEAIGTSIEKFYVESISLPDELQAELDKMITSNMSLRTKKKEKMLDNEMELTNLANKLQLSQNVEDINKFLQMQAALGLTKEGGNNNNTNNNMMNSALEMSMGMNLANQIQNNMSNQNNQNKNNTPPPLTAYYVAANGQSTGPFDMQTLAKMVTEGTLNAQTMVWATGFANWVQAGTVQDLAPLFVQQTPPPPPPPM